MHQKIKKQLTSASLSPEPSAPMHPGCRLLSFVARLGRNSRGEARTWQRRSLPGVYHAHRGPSPVPPFLLSQAYPWSTPSSVQNHPSQVRGRERVTTLELRFLASSSWPRNFSARLGKKKKKKKQMSGARSAFRHKPFSHSGVIATHRMEKGTDSKFKDSVVCNCCADGIKPPF